MHTSYQSSFLNIQKYVHDQFQHIFKEATPTLIQLLHLCKMQFQHRENALIVGDMDFFCYADSICVYRHDPAEDNSVDEWMATLMKNAGVHDYVPDHSDSYSDCIILEEDQNLVYVLVFKSIADGEFEKTNNIELYCLSVNGDHPYFEPFSQFRQDFETIHPIYTIMYKENEENLSGSVMHDTSYFQEIKRFFLNFESILITLADKKMSL